MKLVNKTLALLLSIILIVSLVPANIFAAGDTTNLVYEISATEVAEGDTITLTISTKAMTVSTFGFYVSFDTSRLEVLSVKTEKLQYTEWVENEDGDEEPQDAQKEATEKTTRAKANESGNIAAYWVQTEELEFNETSELLTVTFVALSSGSTDIAITERSSGANGFDNESNPFKETVTINAGDWSGSAVLVTDISDLKIGDKIIITSKDYDYSMSTAQNKNNRGQYLVRKSDDGTTINYSAGTQILTLEAGSNDNTYALYTGIGYLYAASSGSNYLRTENELTANSSWKITITDGVASVIAQGTNTRNVLRYNYANSLFACYASATQQDIQIYKLASDEHTCNPTLVPGQAADCGNAGWKDHFACSCGKLYEDADATKEIPNLDAWKAEDGDGYIAPLGHKDDNKDHACDNGCNVSQGNHADGTDADHLCDYCGEAVEGVNCVHDHYEITATTHQSVCACGKTIGEAVDHTCNHTNHKCAVCGADVPVYLIVKDQAQKDAYSDMIQLTDPDGDGVYTATFKLNDEVPNGQFDISLYHADGTLCGAHTGVYGGYKGKFDQLTFTVKYTPAEKRLDIITDCSHALDHYEVNDDGTHTAYCSCGTDIGTLSGKHDYTTGTKDHTCVCGDVEKFILTIDTIDTTSTSLPVSRTVTLEVPYGTKVMEVLQQAIEDGKITAPNTLFRQKNNYFDGYATTTQYYLDSDAMNELDDQYKMPAKDITVSQGNTVYTGWCYYYTGDQLDGVEYILEGEWLEAGWYFIEEDFDDVEGGAWYCFVPGTGNYAESYNFRVEGTARVPYPTVAINGVTYGANAEDKAYWEAHKDTSKYTDADSALFIFDENGKFQQTTGIVGGNRYAVNGMIGWHVGLVEVDGEYYYFGGDVNGNGNIMMTGNIYASRNTTDLEIVKGGIYTFGEDGKLCKYDGITEIDGKLYYYDHYRLATNAGLIKIDGNYYYVRSGGDKAGQLVVGRDYWITNTNGLLVAGMYTFGADGKIVMGAESEELDGIVNVDGTLYYYKGGVKQIGAGVVQLTDENGETFYIYVRSDGRLATGIYWPTTLNGLLERGAYDWGTDGRYYPAED